MEGPSPDVVSGLLTHHVAGDLLFHSTCPQRNGQNLDRTVVNCSLKLCWVVGHSLHSTALPPRGNVIGYALSRYAQDAGPEEVQNFIQ